MKRLILFTLAIPIFFSCKKPLENVESTILRDEVFTHLIDIQENLTLVGQVISFDMLNDGDFVIGTNNPSNLIFYGKDGLQKKVVPAEEDGPFQFGNPMIIRYYQDKVFLWCNQQLKLITFSSNGIPIQENKFPGGPIRDFIPYQDMVIMMTAGGNKESFVEIYDLQTEKLLQSMGMVTQEQIMLSLASCSGSLTIKDNTLLYMAPDQLSVHRFDLTQLVHKSSKTLMDKEFTVTKVKGSAVDLINSSRSKTFDYIHNNSIVNRILPFADGILVSVETGQYDINQKAKFFDISKRFNKYYLLDTDISIQKSIKTPKTFNDNPCLMVSKGGEIYTIENNADAESFVLKAFSPF